jgi:hypothetical protein
MPRQKRRRLSREFKVKVIERLKMGESGTALAPGGLEPVEQTASAIMIGDLAETTPTGDSIRFKNRRFRFDYEGRPRPLENWATFHGSILAVHLDDGEVHQILGSAVLIGIGIAITARHVVEAFEAEISTGLTGILCSGVMEHGLVLWRPMTVTLFDTTDIAILVMECCSEAPPDSTFTMAVLSTRLPAIGERVCLAGFRVPESLGRYKMRGALYAASGSVLAHYPRGRDTSMLPWPVIEIDTPVLGGMSGGPVFDANGAVCGLITSSYPDGPSYASLVWPVLQTPINPAWPPGALPQEKTLIELGSPIVSIDGPEAVTVRPHPDTGVLVPAYEPWS